MPASWRVALDKYRLKVKIENYKKIAHCNQLKRNAEGNQETSILHGAHKDGHALRAHDTDITKAGGKEGDYINF